MASLPVLPSVTVPVSVGLAELAFRPKVVLKAVPPAVILFKEGRATFDAELNVACELTVKVGIVTVPVNVGELIGAYNPRVVLKAVPLNVTLLVAGRATEPTNE